MADNKIRELDDVIDSIYSDKKLQKLQKKRQPKTVVETLRPIKNILLGVRFFIHGMSMVLASGGVFYLSNKFTQGGFIALCFALLALIAIESIVSYSFTIHHRKKYVDMKFSNWIYYISIPVIILSCVASYAFSENTTRLAVRSIDLVSIDSVSNSFDQKMIASVSYWEGLKKEAQDKADSLHNKNNWKGRTAREVRPLVIQHEAAALSYTDSTTKEKQKIINQKQAAIAQAESDNKAAINEHNEFCSQFGHWTGLLSILSYVFLYFIIGFFEYYDDRELATLESLQNSDSPKVNQSEGQERATLAAKVKQHQSKAKQSEERKEPVFADVEPPQRRPIKFGNDNYEHGQIVMKEGWKKPKMAYKKANGGTSFYSQSKLERMARDKKASEERRKTLNHLANKKEWEQY